LFKRRRNPERKGDWTKTEGDEAKYQTGFYREEPRAIDESTALNGPPGEYPREFRRQGKEERTRKSYAYIRRKNETKRI